VIKTIPKSSTTEDIIEKLFKSRFQDWLQQEHKLTDKQFAYRFKHSDSPQVHRLIPHIATNKQNHKKIALISLDLNKAFDQVNTHTLLAKLIHDKAPTYFIRWIAGTILNRPIQVMLNHTLSSIIQTFTWIRQG
jgi:hypothetical protein